MSNKFSPEVLKQECIDFAAQAVANGYNTEEQQHGHFLIRYEGGRNYLVQATINTTSVFQYIPSSDPQKLGAALYDAVRSALTAQDKLPAELE